MTVGIRAFLLQSPGPHRRARLALLFAIAAGLLSFPVVSIASPTVVYYFSAPQLPQTPPVTNSDGIAPSSKLALGSDGALYGTTQAGGAYGAGSIFRVTTAGSLSNLYSFPAATNSSGAVSYDLGPNDLVQGSDGNFYGTTRSGGSNFTGTIFSMSPSGSFGALHTFAAETTNSSGLVTSADGQMPSGALVQGSDGNFYGTTHYGGANGTGTIFRVSPAGAFTSLYSFSKAAAGAALTNGAVPNALVLGSDGNFYGTTQQGGVDNAGTFFKMTLGGSFTQIYSFNGQAPGNNPITPSSVLVQGANGNFYGTSSAGGSQGGGCVFEITNTGGANVLHSFPQLDAGAASGLTLGVDGNFYGTTAANGLNGEGTLFKMTPAGDFAFYAFSALDTNSDNADGANPSAAPTADALGNLYGTCAAGGTNASGVIFQIVGSNFNPASFLSTSTPAPPRTNTLVGASITLSAPAQGASPLNYQWLRNGTNLTDGGDISGSATSTLVINPVFSRDEGSYTVVVSNAWGPLTGSVTVLTVTPPGVSITLPKAGARTNSTDFAGTATNAPLFAGANPGFVTVTGVIYYLTNLVDGSNITGTASVTKGAGNTYHWSFTATPFAGTNILAVQSVDASGDLSPVVSRTFLYRVPARLTVVATGSGAGTFSLTNGAMLIPGENYSIIARAHSSFFSNWLTSAGGFVTFDPTLSFVMQSNLVLTADFIASQPPAIFISSPKDNQRTASPVLEGTAIHSPVASGVSPTNVALARVTYWLTNVPTGSVSSALATLAQGASISNWSIDLTPSPGTNILAVQCEDVSGGLSEVKSRSFFYEVPALFVLTNSGMGTGKFRCIASAPGDTPPTNAAMLNVTENYTVTADPDRFSRFANWTASDGSVISRRTVSFNMQPGFSLTADFYQTPPVTAISFPGEHLRTNNVEAFRGTASGHYAISNVYCSLANGTNAYALLSAGPHSASNWSVTIPPLPGTNLLTVHCTDVNGNQSLMVSREFFLEVPAPLSVTKLGPGNGAFRATASVAGNTIPANGAMLNIGEAYTITALPDKSSLFSNWVSTAGANAPVESDAPKFSFIMQSNLDLAVTFVANFFPPVVGKYNGLFFPANDVTTETSGMLYNLVLGKKGAFSARLLMAGATYSISSSFDASSNANFSVGPLSVALTLDTSVPDITGTVSVGQVTANLRAEYASNVLASAAYTMLFSPSTNVSAGSPPGDGYALVANHAGTVTLSGELADGTRYDQTVPVSRSGDVPVYASLYSQSTNTHAGLLLGWINLTNLQAAPPTNMLTWIKLPFDAPPRYTGGFTNSLILQGASWTKPSAHAPAISFAGGDLTISNTDLILDFSGISVSNNALARSTDVPTNFLAGSINPQTGLVTLSFAGGNGRSKVTARGAFLQDTTNAGGFFLTSSNAGSFNLQP
jgi:uncharacterized repeat protein (TIGR03803 family)